MIGLRAVLDTVDIALLAFLIIGVIAWRSSLARELSQKKGSLFPALIMAIGLHVCFVKPFIPHNIWHEKHAVENLTGGPGEIHGPTYSNVMALLHTGTAGAFSRFSMNYLLSLGSVILLFLLLRVYTRKELPALAAGSLLLYLPVHVRLAVTETPFICVEFFLLAMLLLLALFFKTKDTRYFLLGLSAALLAAFTRGEMMLLVPVLLSLYCLVLGRKVLREKIRHPRIVAGTAAAALLYLLSAVVVLSQKHPFARNFFPPRPLDGLWDINAFFHVGFTPPSYWLLALAGLWYLAKKQRKHFLWLNLFWMAATYFYTLHANLPAYNVRTSLATQFVFVIFAAFGFLFIQEKWRSTRPLYALLGAVIFSAPILQYKFLGVLYTHQQEFLFLNEIHRDLPAQSLVVYLAQDDDRDLLQDRDYQSTLLVFNARKRGRELSTAGIRSFLAEAKKVSLENVFFYKGTACYTLMRKSSLGDKVAGPEDYTHPLCAAIEDKFLLRPVRETVVSRNSSGHDSIQGRQRTIGLYEVVRALRKPREEARVLSSAWSYFRVSVRELNAWIQAAQFVRGIRPLAVLLLRIGEGSDPRGEFALAYADMGEEFLALRAVERTLSRDPSPEERRQAALMHQRFDDCSRAIEILTPLTGDKSMAALAFRDRGVCEFIRGEPGKAERDFKAALRIEPGLLSAALSLGSVYASQKRFDLEQKVYDKALLAPPLEKELPLREALVREKSKEVAE